MDLDNFVKGAVAALLTDQVAAKTGPVTKITLAVAAASLVVAVLADAFFRWLAVFVILVALALVVFVFVSKRVAIGIINRLAPPIDLTNSRQHFDTAIAEADIPTGPVGFLRFIWRLRRGVGPELERLGVVVSRLRSGLD